MNKSDSLGDRMKNLYEDRFRFLIPRRTNIIIRVDGKAFHTLTRSFAKPFDEDFANDMNETCKYLCANIQGAKMGYVQSDEISILITDYDDLTTSAWFDNNLQKICSISASLATVKFNEQIHKRGILKSAMFDSRVFIIPEQEEVINYFIWRQQDATKNSISMAAQSTYSAKQLLNKSGSVKQDMMMEKGINWNDYPSRFKRGGAVIKQSSHWAIKLHDITKKPIGKPLRIDDLDSIYHSMYSDKNLKIFERSEWEVVETPIFTQDREFINKLFPTNN